MAYNFAFSYSRWALWKKCPAAYKYQNIDKIDTGPPSPALAEGRKVHDDIKYYLQGKSDIMPSRLAKNFATVGEGIRDITEAKSPSLQAIIEENMAFDRDWRPVSWFGKNAYARFIWDAGIYNDNTKSFAAIDWKTGKKYDSYDEQMQIFSMPAFLKFQDLQTFNGHLLFLDSGEDAESTITREQFMDYVYPTWTGNIKMMEADQSFTPTPSKEACKFCDFGPRKLGICPVGV